MAIDNARFTTLAVNVALGIASDEEKAEFLLLKKAAKKELKGDKTTPEGLITMLRNKIAKLENAIAYVEENGCLPPVKTRQRKSEVVESAE